MRGCWGTFGIVLVWGALVAACDSAPALPPKDTGDTTDPSCTVQPTLSSLKEQYFKGSCVFDGCHDQSSAEGSMDLSADDVYGELVNVGAADPNAGPRGKIRVIPGDPDNSFMVEKVEGRMADDEGDWMPQGTDEPIDPDCRIKMLRQWISDGAQDN